MNPTEFHEQLVDELIANDVNISLAEYVKVTGEHFGITPDEEFVRDMEDYVMEGGFCIPHEKLYEYGAGRDALMLFHLRGLEENLDYVSDGNSHYLTPFAFAVCMHGPQRTREYRRWFTHLEVSSCYYKKYLQRKLVSGAFKIATLSEFFTETVEAEKAEAEYLRSKLEIAVEDRVPKPGFRKAQDFWVIDLGHGVYAFRHGREKYLKVVMKKIKESFPDAQVLLTIKRQPNPYNLVVRFTERMKRRVYVDRLNRLFSPRGITHEEFLRAILLVNDEKYNVDGQVVAGSSEVVL